jgi:hypothetical protein
MSTKRKSKSKRSDIKPGRIREPELLRICDDILRSMGFKRYEAPRNEFDRLRVALLPYDE